MTYSYDLFLFGNGLTINLLNQLKPFIPIEKHYLLNIDSFLITYINDSLTSREQNKINILYRGNSSSDIYIKNKKLRNELSKFYEHCDGNIEYWFGVDLFNKNNTNYDYEIIQSIFPVLYNIWFDVLYDYLDYSNLLTKISSFNKSINKILNKPLKNITTNFDWLFDELNPEHIHGSFVENIKQYNDLILEFEDDSKNTFKFKTCWGHNGIGKGIILHEYFSKNMYANLFTYDFLFNLNLSFDNILIYGMGFQKSGYTKALEKVDEIYYKPQTGGVIDEHILIRLLAMQNRNQLKSITFAFYSDSELNYYEELTELYNLKNVTYIRSSEFNFTINFT